MANPVTEWDAQGNPITSSAAATEWDASGNPIPSQPALDLSNKQGQGTYQMTDRSGQTAAVPYGQVRRAAETGYKFADDANQFRYNKDYRADPNNKGGIPMSFSPAPGDPRADPAYQTQMEKNLPLPMQVVGGIAKGGATLARPIMDAQAAAMGVSPQDVDQMLTPQTPAQAVGKYGTMAAAVVPAAVAAPVATAGGVVGGTLAGTGANVIARAAGASPQTTQLVTDAAGLVGGAGGALGARPLVSALDFSAQKQAAGALLQSVAQDANKVPVELENASDAALRLMDWQKKTNLGPTVNKFLNRITSPNQGPLTYEDARDFYQVLGKLSVEETNKLAPSARRDLTEMVAGLKQDIGNAADTVGRAADYYQGLGDYATASKYQSWSDSVKDFLAKEGIKAVAKGVGATAGGGAAYGLWKWLTGK